MSADLSAAERRVLDAIDETELVATLVKLVRTPSVTGTDAEADLQHTVARWFEEAGLEVDLNFHLLDVDEVAGLVQIRSGERVGGRCEAQETGHDRDARFMENAFV